MVNNTEITLSLVADHRRTVGLATAGILKALLHYSSPTTMERLMDFPVAHLGSGGGEVEICSSRDDVIGQDRG